MTVTMTVTRGDSLTWTFTVGTSVVGWTPKFTAKPRAGYENLADGSASLVATVGAGLTVTDAANGIIDMVIDSTDTVDLVPGIYVWDLQLTSGSSVRSVEWDTSGPIGILVVTADVSRT